VAKHKLVRKNAADKALNGLVKLYTHFPHVRAEPYWQKGLLKTQRLAERASSLVFL
jgi:hypothetical protein